MSTTTGIPVRPADTYENRMEMYARQSRNANVTTAVIAAVFALLTAVSIIVIGLAIVHGVHALGTPAPSPTCATQGGTDFSC